MRTSPLHFFHCLCLAGDARANSPHRSPHTCEERSYTVFHKRDVIYLKKTTSPAAPVYVKHFFLNFVRLVILFRLCMCASAYRLPFPYTLCFTCSLCLSLVLFRFTFFFGDSFSNCIPNEWSIVCRSISIYIYKVLSGFVPISEKASGDSRHVNSDAAEFSFVK